MYRDVGFDSKHAIFRIGYIEDGDVVQWRGTGFLGTFGSNTMSFTAAHVVDVQDPKNLICSFPSIEKDFSIKEMRIHPNGKDITKILFDSCDLTGFEFHVSKIEIGQEVYAYGYPVSEEESGARCLRGYVSRYLDRPFGFQQPSYELSFAVPEGISGSPLLLGSPTDNSRPDVTGLIYGNGRTEKIEDSYEETSIENIKEIHVTKRIIFYGLAHDGFSLWGENY